MDNPKVSILMATYNRANMIGLAIESVQAQTLKNWELVIADDGSTDNTPEVVVSWQRREPRIVYVRNPVNQGISKNYNTGFRVMKGEYVAMIDDDDPWCDPDKLKKQIDFLDKNPDYVGCGGGVIVISDANATRIHTNDAKNNTAPGRELYRYFKPETDEEIRRYILFSNPMANSTTMFRREAGEKVGWYDESTRYSGDRDFWLKMGRTAKLCNFHEYFSYYTMSGANTSIVKIRPHLKASLIIMKRYKNDYPNYYPALAFNELQYAYSFIPEFIRKPIHSSLARLKRLLVG